MVFDRRLFSLLLCLTTLAVAPTVLAQTPQGTAFTYQGELRQNGVPVTANTDMTFALFDAGSGGNPVGASLTFASATGNAVVVQSGIFSVVLDFGSTAFAGIISEERYLSITINGTVLNPRTKIENAPYSLQSRTAELAYSVSNASIGTAQVLPAQVQLRINGNCAVGSSIRAIAQDGTVTCQAGGIGTVSNVGSGTGLTGGPITGSGTLAIANAGVGLAQIDNTQVQARVSGVCSSGQKVLAVNVDGSVVCATDAVGGSGTVTSIATGTGLTGGPVTAAGTLSIANGGVGLAQINTGQVQARVSGTCFLGEYIRGINPDGSLMCAPVVGAQRTTVLDNYSGSYSAMVIGINGFPVISYFDGQDGDLIVAHCLDSSCTSATSADVDHPGIVGLYTSIAIGQDQLPIVSYYDQTNADLKIAHCENADCTASTITAVDTGGSVGKFSSIAIGTDGFPVLSYFDETNGHLKVAHCDNVACSIVGTLTTIDASADTGYYSSLAIGTDGLPIVAYFDGANQHLKVIHCGNAFCVGAVTTTTVDSALDVGYYSKIAIGADGLAIITYSADSDVSRSLKIAHCSNATCSAASISTINSTGFVLEAAMTIGADQFPIVSYYEQSNEDLWVAHCNNASCTSATVAIMDGTGATGEWSAIAIGYDGLPIISYTNADTGFLYVVKCNNRLCK